MKFTNKNNPELIYFAMYTNFFTATFAVGVPGRACGMLSSPDLFGSMRSISCDDIYGATQ